MTYNKLPRYVTNWLKKARNFYGESNVEAVERTELGYIVRSRISPELDWGYWELPDPKNMRTFISQRSPKL